jgi:hypothetical protein
VCLKFSLKEKLSSTKIVATFTTLRFACLFQKKNHLKIYKIMFYGLTEKGSKCRKEIKRDGL